MVKLTKNQRTGLYLGAGAALVGAFVVRELIDLADQRFENKRDRVEQNTDQAMKELEERLNTKVQMALDNPLAN